MTEDPPVVDADGGLSIPVWFSNGGMMVRRDCLPTKHPGSTYQYLKRHGYNPADYGYYEDEPDSGGWDGMDDLH